MSLFNNHTTEGHEETEDRLGGFKRFDTDVYSADIKAAYAGKSASSNAQSVTFLFDIGGAEYRETIWVTDGENKNYYHPKDRDGKRNTAKRETLPGWVTVDDICLVTTEKPLNQQVTEEKTMNVYDPDAKKELPKAVPMLVDLLGKKVSLAIVKNLVNKEQKNAAGKYEPIEDTREENEIDKVFHHELGVTITEARKGLPATFQAAWLEKNKGQTFDRRKLKGNGQGGTAGKPGAAPQAAAAAAAKTPSLFGAK